VRNFLRPSSAVNHRTFRALGSMIGRGLMASGAVGRAKARVLSEEIVTPLLFHNPTKKNFRTCVRWLMRNGYVFISSDDVIGLLKGELAVPKGAVWLSCDDGWRGLLENVIPAIEEYDIPLTLFVSTDPVERTGVFWTSLAERHAAYLPWPYRGRPLMLRAVPEEERAEIIGRLERKFLQGWTREALTIEETAQLSRLPQITIGSHGVHHAVLPNCTESELDDEIGRSQAALQDWTGKPVRIFSYPFGSFDGRVNAVLRKYGYALASTTEKRFMIPGDDPYAVPRLSVPDNAAPSEAFSRMTGVFNPFIAAGIKLGLT
jgi:peptidoglycan/xylan/chitin deacetylase (PgdA/CDA1 family)